MLRLLYRMCGSLMSHLHLDGQLVSSCVDGLDLLGAYVDFHCDFNHGSRGRRMGHRGQHCPGHAFVLHGDAVHR